MSEGRWSSDWLDQLGTDRVGWSHSGMSTRADGTVVAAHPVRPELLGFSAQGALLWSVPLPVTEAHGMQVVGDGGQESIWVADIANRPVLREDGEFDHVTVSQHGAVLELDFEGRERRRLETPRLPDYAGEPLGRYAPTDVDVAEQRRGGAGDVWVADGYGQGLVHRFDAAGAHLLTLRGPDADTAFDCPHGIAVDWRGDEPRILVADRGNAVVRVFDADGGFVANLGEGILTSPSAFAFAGDALVVGELHGTVQVFDPDGQLVRRIADEGPRGDGWPHALDDEGRPRPVAHVAGAFTAPHGLTVDSAGGVLVSEWTYGGRVVRVSGLL